jgi:hypothetical protein
MKDRIQNIMRQMKNLEQDLLLEIHKKEEEFFYRIQDKRVMFEEKIRAQHASLMKSVPRYLLDASLLNVLSSPLIWACLVPAFLLDMAVSLFQMVCFPIYGIPKVRKKDYIVHDRNYLSYLNAIERINCTYCAYFVGLIAFVQEVAARTEQYWCPVKHARKLRAMHSRYEKFIDYGDCTTYREELESIRRDFEDLR